MPGPRIPRSTKLHNVQRPHPEIDKTAGYSTYRGSQFTKSAASNPQSPSLNPVFLLRLQYSVISHFIAEMFPVFDPPQDQASYDKFAKEQAAADAEEKACDLPCSYQPI